MQKKEESFTKEFKEFKEFDCDFNFDFDFDFDVDDESECEEESYLSTKRPLAKSNRVAKVKAKQARKSVNEIGEAKYRKALRERRAHRKDPECKKRLKTAYDHKVKAERKRKREEAKAQKRSVK